MRESHKNLEVWLIHDHCSDTVDLVLTNGIVMLTFKAHTCPRASSLKWLWSCSCNQPTRLSQMQPTRLKLHCWWTLRCIMTTAIIKAPRECGRIAESRIINIWTLPRIHTWTFPNAIPKEPRCNARLVTCNAARNHSPNIGAIVNGTQVQTSIAPSYLPSEIPPEYCSQRMAPARRT